MKFSSKVIVTVFFPILIAILFFIINIIDSPASVTRIDPEYLCLLNGLNVSILQFDNIGYTDLPGTPFLILTGIFVRLTHLFFGNSPIIEDVISRPDFYIQASSYLFILLTASILIWGGLKVLKATNHVLASIALQSSLLLSPVCLTMQIRYSADRLLPLLAFIFAVYTILYLFNSLNTKRYVIYSGIILGIGFITKFNFIALAILPLFIVAPIKNWLIYAGTFTASSFLSFLPIISKFDNVKRFLVRLISHGGTYGHGEQEFLNWGKMVVNLKKIFQLNEAFAILFLLTLVIILISVLSKAIISTNRKKTLFLVGFILASVIEAIMVSKHFKNYYLIPVLSLSGIVFFLIWDIHFNQKKSKLKLWVGFILLVLMIAFSLADTNQHSKTTKHKLEARNKTLDFFENQMQPNDYLLLEPAWISGLSKINGLLWGISYVADKNDFTKYYLEQYSNVLTFEGNGRPLKHFRTKDVNTDEVFKAGNIFYLFSTPGRHTKALISEFKIQAGKVNKLVKIDTLFKNPLNKDILLKSELAESFRSDSLTTMSFFNGLEEEKSHWNQKSVVIENPCNGKKSIKIERQSSTGSIFNLNPIENQEGKLFALEVSCNYYQIYSNHTTRLIIEATNPNGKKFWHSVFCADYANHINQWENILYKIYLPEYVSNAQHLRVYFYNRSKHHVYIDDININVIYKKG